MAQFGTEIAKYYRPSIVNQNTFAATGKSKDPLILLNFLKKYTCVVLRVMMIGEQRYQCVVQNCRWMRYCGWYYGNKCYGRNFINYPVFTVRFTGAIAASIPNRLTIATVSDRW